MLQWIAQNQAVVTAITGIGTLLVWIVYLQVFVSSYRRQLRPKILITRGAGDGLEAHCFVSNMSSDPVYIESILLTLEVPDDEWACPVTDLLDLEDDDAKGSSRSWTRQGPLRTAEMKDIGSFLDLVRHVLRRKQGRRQAELGDAIPDWLRAVKVEVLGAYGTEDLLIGARRRFVVIAEEGEVRLQGDRLFTEQITRRAERKRLIERLKQDP